MSTEEKRKGCSRCHVDLPETHFNQKRNGDLNSICIRCLDVLKRWRDKKREGRLSDTSSEDSHIEITEKKCGNCMKILSIDNFMRRKDGKLYACCISCTSYHRKYREEKRYCIHNTQKQYCKECNDPIQVTIRNMIMSSKHKDKLHKRYDPVNFIDRCFLESLIEDCEDQCHYCQTPLQYTEYGPDMGTLERLDNKIGHIKSNCTIACLSCNKSHNSRV